MLNGERKLKIAEMFYSLQGEGGLAGSSFIFIRLAGCSLACDFCDTDHAEVEEYTPEELLRLFPLTSKPTGMDDKMRLTFSDAIPCKRILWTGGEPLLQLDAETIGFFQGKGFFQAIETNGTRQLPPGLDYVSVSPKLVDDNGMTAHSIKDGKWTRTIFDTMQYRKWVDEVRICVPELGWLGRCGRDLPRFLRVNRHYLSPNTESEDFPAIMEECIQYCLDNPFWNLSIQQHKKLWKIR